MSYNYELRIVTPQGKLGVPLPDAANVSFLDDDVDVGALSFDYPIGGRYYDRLELRQEVALLIDGDPIPNGNFFLEEYSGNTASEDGVPVRTWSGSSLIARLDEALVLPDRDEHTREDVFTEAEREELQEKRHEWYEQAKRKAIKEAKEKAREHNENVRDRRKGGKDGAAHPRAHVDKDVNRWGKKAIRWANNQISNPSQNWYHLCQSFVRQSFGLPGIYGTAREAWFAGTKRTNTPINKIPAGVPVYWAPNHVALSIGGGDCISTDVLRAGDADVVPIASLHNGVHWSLTFRGWSTEVSGRKIYP